MKPAVHQPPSSSSSAPRPVQQHSAGESYEISDREDSSDEDYDYSDEEEEATHKKVHKNVPEWARGDALKMVSLHFLMVRYLRIFFQRFHGKTERSIC